jgi:hypothetical protein
MPPPGTPPPAAVPPILTPEDYEEFPTFPREIFLVFVTHATANATLRVSASSSLTSF